MAGGLFSRLRYWLFAGEKPPGEPSGAKPEAEPEQSASQPGPRGVSNPIRDGQPSLALERLQRWRGRYLSARRNAVREALLRLEAPDCDEAEREGLLALLRDTEASGVTEGLVRKANSKVLPLEGVASFRESIALRSRRGQLAGSAPEWKLNNKARGYKFVAKWDIPHPRVFQEKAGLADLETRTAVVIKPMSGAGSRGVYLVLGDGRVFEPKRGQWLDDWQAMTLAMQVDLESGRVRHDRWMVEELVTEDEAGLRPGRDLKFYCFFGKVGLVLEVDRWQRQAYCEWDDSGNQVFSGKYDEQRFEGEGVSAEQIKLVAKLSRRIPAPFIRIDFLRSAHTESGLSFCEFTPRPGNFHRFGQETDRRLGELYLEAEARLQRHFLKGKRFPSPFSPPSPKKSPPRP